MSKKENITKTLLTARFDKINPESIEDYINLNGYEALKKALNEKPENINDEIKKSNLKGRGGAAFPTGIKMEAVRKGNKKPKYLICNADEGEPGNFKDRYLMEKDPHQLIEGILIGAYIVGAEKGYIYIRGEYNKSIDIINKALSQAREKGYLGKNIMGKDFNFELEVFSGAGAYVCGEEFALLVSIEGKPGRSTYKPPFPTTEGLYNKPTLINNVETFANLPYIINNGAESFKAIGTEASSGTKLISLSGNVNNPGLYEVPFGVKIKDIVFNLGNGVQNGRKIKMVQLAGASGPCIPENMLDIGLDYSTMADNGLTMGSGAVIVIDDTHDVLDVVKRISEFFKHESCGKCTPCREGNTHILKILNKFIEGKAFKKDLELLETLSDVMFSTSICGLGQAAPTALKSTLKYFREEYIKKINVSSPGKKVV